MSEQSARKLREAKESDGTPEDALKRIRELNHERWRAEWEAEKERREKEDE